MIIYSNTGARPPEDALKKIKEQKNICCVQIRDKKYGMTKGFAKEKLDALFDGKTPYCLCDDIERTMGELKPFFCPAIVCSSNKGNWVMMKNYKMIPIGSYKQMEKLDIFYLDFEYGEKQKVLPLPAPKKNDDDDSKNMVFKDESARNFWYQLKDLFTSNYNLPYCYWDATSKCYRQTFDDRIRNPIGYEQLRILKTGGYDVDWAELVPDIDDYQEGYTNGKLIGKIEKYVMEVIKETKGYAKKAAFDMDYQEKEYYLAEMQSAFLVLRACLHLKRCRIKIKEDVLKHMASYIMPKNGWVAKGLELSTYMEFHIEDIADKIL